jgi:hypothetical protein
MAEQPTPIPQEPVKPAAPQSPIFKDWAAI